MLSFKIIWPLLYLVFVSVTSLSIDKFVWDYNNVKCCAPGEILTNSSSSYKCVNDVNSKSVLEAPMILPAELFGKSACIDIVEDIDSDIRKVVELNKNTLNEIPDLHYFSKCCPINLVYDLQNHRCVKRSHTNNSNNSITSRIEAIKNSRNNTLLHIKYGLGGCNTVISDHELLSVNFNDKLGIFIEQLNKTFDYGKFCIDNVYNKESYVVRVCHNDFDICKKKSKMDNDKLLCLRKCCPDGESYNVSPKCTIDFEHGFILGNNTLSNSQEPYAIVPGNSCRKYMSMNQKYILNEVGSLRLIMEDKPPLFLSPFMDTYCYEHAFISTSDAMNLFVCFVDRNNNKKLSI